MSRTLRSNCKDTTTVQPCHIRIQSTFENRSLKTYENKDSESAITDIALFPPQSSALSQGQPRITGLNTSMVLNGYGFTEGYGYRIRFKSKKSHLKIADCQRREARTGEIRLMLARSS